MYTMTFGEIKVTNIQNSFHIYRSALLSFWAGILRCRDVQMHSIKVITQLETNSNVPRPSGPDFQWVMSIDVEFEEIGAE
jgi:hypothetical protein